MIQIADPAAAQTAESDTPNTSVAPAPAMQRARRGRLLLGVCAGTAAYVGWDVWYVRGLFVALACIAGLGVGVYLIAAVLLPLEPAPA